VPNSRELLPEVRKYPNSLLMGEVEGRNGQGSITGLNGLLLGVAKARGVPGVCLLGEIPVYIGQFPVPYPKASKSILEVLALKLGLALDTSKLDMQAKEVEQNIERLYHLIPEEIRKRLDKLKNVNEVKEEKPGTITEEDEKKIMQEVEEFFKKGGKQD
jgi:proteasome assembly chaperone (PAC2) family protein